MDHKKMTNKRQELYRWHSLQIVMKMEALPNSSTTWSLFLFLFSVLDIEPRVLCRPGKPSTSEPHLQLPPEIFFKRTFFLQLTLC
jgi:hypothetical protein